MSHTNACKEFLQWALPRLKLRPEGYRKVRRQVCRKIQTRIAGLHLSGFDAYRSYLENHPAEWQELDKLTRISISRFFRDYQSWEMLGKEILPVLTKNAVAENRPVRCWSAGCASGEEPYSLALLWQQHVGSDDPKQIIEIIATDVDEHMLQRASLACYPGGNIRDVPKHLIERYFRKEGSLFCLDESIKKMVDFQKQDIRIAMPDGPFEIVFCKNLVAMYFEKESALASFKEITGRLASGGFLFTGNHEPFPVADLQHMTVFNRGLNIFRKKFPERKKGSA